MAAYECGVFYHDDNIMFSEKVLSSADGLDQTGFVARGLTYGASTILKPVSWKSFRETVFLFLCKVIEEAGSFGYHSR